jgi:predicted ATP-grasp superfamily ATP-dependent carboligase
MVDGAGPQDYPMRLSMSNRANPVQAPAIVLGVEHPRGAAVLQSLGRLGASVTAVDHYPDALGMWSRFISEKILVPETYDAALHALEAFADRTPNARPLLIATNDHYLVLVSRNFERLSTRFVVTTPRWEVLSTLMDKRRCYELASSIGLNVPSFFAPSSAEEIKRVFAGLDFQKHDYLFTKPLPTGEPTDGSTRRFTRVAGIHADTARARYMEIFERTGDLPMISEVVPGESASCIGVSLVLDFEHRPVAAFCVKRLQLRPYKKDEGFIHPYALGANVYCESTHDDEAVEAAARLLRAARYSGIATVEFRRDANTGALKLIKVDPRVVRATSLSAAVGIDLPAALFRVFTAQPPTVAKAYPDGVAWIWLSAFFATVREQGLWTQWRLRALLRDSGRIRAAAYFSRHDPMPFIIDSSKSAGRFIRRHLSGVQRYLLRNMRPSETAR